jgi:GxxExxY protein
MRGREELNSLTEQVIGAALDVHRELGPGLLESSYEACLTFELLCRGLSIERQKALPLSYRGHTLECGYRIDLLVEEEVIVEVKAIECLEPVQCTQLLSYLRLSKLRVGFLLNFNVKWLTQGGVRRVVNAFPE